MPSNAAKNINHHSESRAYRSTFFMLVGLWALLWFACLGVSIGLWVYGYDLVTLKVAHTLGKTKQLTILRAQYLTPNLFLAFHVFSGVFLIAWSLLYRRLAQLSFFVLKLTPLTQQAFAPLLMSWRHCSLSQKMTLAITFLFILASRLYYSAVFTLQYDEAFTYIHLVSKGVLTSAIYYPGPNNHVFFSELAAVLHTGLPTLAALRLPSIVASLVFWALLWQWLYAHTRFEWAWLLATLGVFLPLMSVYSVMGRGYSLQLVFVLLTFRSGLAAHYQTQHRLVLVVGSVLGFYTIPTFLYPFASLVVFQSWQLWRQNKQTLKKWAIDVCLVLGLTGVLYSPIILANGWAALLGNAWVKPLNWAAWWQQLPTYLLTWEGVLWGLVLLLALMFWRRASKFIVVCVLTSGAMIALQRVLPPQRVWLWLWIPLVYTLALFLGKGTTTQVKSYFISALLASVCLFFMVRTSRLFAQMPTKNYPYIQVAKKITSMSTPQRVFVQHDTYGVYLQYMCLHASPKHVIDTQLNPQTKYDWLIFRKPLSKRIEKEYKVFLENEEVVVYQR